MKKGWIILTNVLLSVLIVALVTVHTRNESRAIQRSQVEAFETMTVAMEQVAANYLEGEQRICDTWATNINAHRFTLEEATDFVRVSHIIQNRMAHLIYTDDASLSGLSTIGRANDPEDRQVSYANFAVIREILDQEMDPDQAISITRAYPNPINGTQSIAFYNRIALAGEGEGETRDALLLYIVPVTQFEKRWRFPTDEYSQAEIALIDAQGNYILNGPSFQDDNFFAFYQACNQAGAASLSRLRQAILSTGSFTMTDARGAQCLMAHTPVKATRDWSIVTYIPLNDLQKENRDWVMIGIVSVGLLAVFILDMVFMMQYNKKLSAAAAEAAEANRAKTDFLSTMSHDIRTPMNAIIGLTAIAAKNVHDPDSITENLRKINLASNHLLTLINDILDISKVESGKLNLSPVSFSIVETADNLVNISQPMVKEKNIDFNFRIHGIEHEHLYADQLRINQIFINLLSNAVKYTEPGGRVCLDLSEEAGSTPHTVKLVYVVADTGIGMTPEFMEKMYQPFSRQTDSRVNVIQGTGLGLAITKQMIGLMGGEIRCESQVGKGTTFTVTLELPLADRLVEAMMLPPIQVLVADDDPVLLDTAKDTLRSIGAQADVATNGLEAVEKAEKRHRAGQDYQVVILDWKMPDVDGIEAARRIRAQVGESVPILLISAYDWSDLEEEAHAAGVTGFISKPLFKSTLYTRISELLGTTEKGKAQEDDTADIAGTRILVAEDNDVNWEIISMLLQMHGVAVERAENGQLAVERVANMQKGDFDLIFMDIQMPVMNGLDACRAIRKLPNPSAAALPIIAMTADAFSENVAECLAAGMNGHIAKPVDMKLVLKEIRKIREAS